ncbi:DUF2878 domain-containing protein [Halofilum ochraceum]|uniref:DUF2878 domain-containing protein n=1 Tax=Halofilum ochraceum TaxID=1611323 RepID=UPI0009F5F8F2|nr:DUF2878 domain-containing protein [Halofilum ochraceum]
MTAGKPSLPLILWNIVSINIGWFTCVLGAANGYIWLGPLVVAVLVAIHLKLIPARRRELATLAAAALFGYAIDSAMVLAGVFDFPAQARVGAPSTVWMVALWVNFAMALNVALHWLQRSYLLAALLGAVGGPMAYFSGTQFGGLLAPEGVAVLIGAVAVQWAIATPLVVAGAARIGRWAGQPVPAEATGARG